jgi:hypothetical protein
MYKREALEFPNPVLVEATAPTMSHVTSTIVCPAFAAPNRTLACILYANGPDGTPTGDASFAASLSSNTTVNATLVDASNSYAVPAVGVFSGEGRYSILMIPASFGSLSVSVQIQPGDFLQPAVVTIAANFNESCNVASRVLNSFMLATQAMQGSTDTSVYGVSATGAAYDAVTGVCDRPKI